jgi:hypothetical protein
MSRPKLAPPYLRALRREKRLRIDQSNVVYRREVFAREFVLLRENGIGETKAWTQAAIAAGYSERTAHVQGGQLLRRPEIKAIVDAHMKRHIKKFDLKAVTVLQYWYDIATAELPLPPVGACRHCYGQDFRYQFTLDEYRDKFRAHTRDQLRKENANLRVPFDELGGTGFDKTRRPNPECPECNGTGIHHPLIIDREKMTAAQRFAIDEVRVHRDGSVSLKMRDRSRAMENLQQLMGMIQPRKPVEVLDPARPLEENVDVVLQTAIDQGLITSGKVIEHDPIAAPELADTLDRR